MPSVCGGWLRFRSFRPFQCPPLLRGAMIAFLPAAESFRLAFGAAFGAEC